MNYIKGFDGLRAFSIMLVLLTHLDLYNRLPKNEFIQTRFWPLISGEAGVMIFFVISGFLITSLLLHEKKLSGTIKIRHFFIRRFIRLLPALIVFYVMIIGSILFDFLVMPIEGLFYAFFYVYNFIPNQFYTYELGHLWSLSLEEQFYFTWPFIVSFFSKTAYYLVLIGIILSASIFAYFTFESNPNFENYKPLRFFIPAVSPILIGCLGAIINHFYLNKMQQLFKNNVLFRSLSGILMALIFFSFPLFSPEVLFPINQLFQSLGVVILLLWIFHHQTSIFVSFLENSPIKYIGTISYGLYVFQGFFLRTGGGGEAWIHHTPWNILLTLVFAIASYELIERKVLTYKRNFA